MGDQSSIKLKLPPQAILKQLMMGEEHADVAAVLWNGTPLPPALRLAGDFKLRIKPKEVISAGGKGALPTFTRDFPHDKIPPRKGVSEGAFRRAASDDFAFPVTNYEKGALLWRDHVWSKSDGAGSSLPDPSSREWRTLSANERARVHMLPESAILPLNRGDRIERWRGRSGQR